MYLKNDINFDQELLKIRKKYNLTQDAMATTLSMSRTSYIAYEKPNVMPSVKLLMRIEEAFKDENAVDLLSNAISSTGIESKFKLVGRLYNESKYKIKYNRSMDNMIKSLRVTDVQADTSVNFSVDDIENVVDRIDILLREEFLKLKSKR